MAEKGAVLTASGIEVPELVIQASAHIDKTTIIYGPSRTGKTHIVKAIMKVLKPRIEQVLVVCPTEAMNRAYEGLVPPQAIHLTMAFKPDENAPKARALSSKEQARLFMHKIIARQTVSMGAWRDANKPHVLAKLYDRVRSSECDIYMNKILRKKKETIERLQAQLSHKPSVLKDKIAEVGANFDEAVGLMYKKFISVHREQLWRQKLTHDERCSLQYLYHNPRILLIFDDCAATLKPLLGMQEFREVWYQGRHYGMTTIVCAHDYADIHKNLRNNTFISIFTTADYANEFWPAKASKSKKQAAAIADEIISEKEPTPHRKLAYIRDDPKGHNFYHVTAPAVEADFRFGSLAFRELCDKVAGEAPVDPGNQFAALFQVQMH